MGSQRPALNVYLESLGAGDVQGCLKGLAPDIVVIEEVYYQDPTVIAGLLT